MNQPKYQEYHDLPLVGAVTHHSWYREILLPSGHADIEAIALLSRLVYKHRLVWNANRGRYVSQAGFAGGVFQTRLDQLAGWVCLSAECVRLALLRLQARGLVQAVCVDDNFSGNVSIHLCAEEILKITTGSVSTSSKASRGRQAAERSDPSVSEHSTGDASAARSRSVEVNGASSTAIARQSEQFLWWWAAYGKGFGISFPEMSGDGQAVQAMILHNTDYSVDDLLVLAVRAWHQVQKLGKCSGYDPYFHTRRSFRIRFFCKFVEAIAKEIQFWDTDDPKAVNAFMDASEDLHMAAWKERRSQLCQGDAPGSDEGEPPAIIKA